jgi:hypothetical protein
VYKYWAVVEGSKMSIQRRSLLEMLEVSANNLLAEELQVKIVL